MDFGEPFDRLRAVSPVEPLSRAVQGSTRAQRVSVRFAGMWAMIATGQVAVRRPSW